MIQVEYVEAPTVSDLEERVNRYLQEDPGFYQLLGGPMAVVDNLTKQTHVVQALTYNNGQYED